MMPMAFGVATLACVCVYLFLKEFVLFTTLLFKNKRYVDIYMLVASILFFIGAFVSMISHANSQKPKKIIEVEKR